MPPHGGLKLLALGVEEVDVASFVASRKDVATWRVAQAEDTVVNQPLPDAATAIPDHVPRRNVHVRIGQALYQVDSMERAGTTYLEVDLSDPADGPNCKRMAC